MNDTIDATLSTDERRARMATAIGIVALLAAAVLLVLAFQFPFITSSFNLKLPDWIPNWGGMKDNLVKNLSKSGQVPMGPQYLAKLMRELFEMGEYAIGIMVVGFSLVFPTLKIVATGVLLFGRRRISDARRLKYADWLGFLAKWSMGDIFIVALIIVLVKAEGFAYKFTAEAGVFCYAGSAILASVAASMVKWTVKKPLAA